MTCPLEHEEQKAVVKWFDAAYPQYSGRLFAVPNGAHLAGNTGQRAAKINKMKAEGMRVGVPDLCLPVSRCNRFGLFIEMKRQTGNKATEAQLDWIDFLNTEDYAAGVCKGAEQAIKVISAYMKGELCATCWMEHGDPECTGEHATDNGYS